MLPVLNKVGSFLTIPYIRNILVKNQRQLSLRKIMDTRTIFLVNLAKGQIGVDASHLLGGLLISSFASASFSRVNVFPDERVPFLIYLDEFQNYTTGSIANMVAELRKFKVSFVFAHQYLYQLTDDIRNAVLGNIGTTVCFTLGQSDARYMEREFSPEFKAEDFVNLPHYAIYLKLLVDGRTSRGFSAQTITIHDPVYRRIYEGGG